MNKEIALNVVKIKNHKIAWFKKKSNKYVNIGDLGKLIGTHRSHLTVQWLRNKGEIFGNKTHKSMPVEIRHKRAVYLQVIPAQLLLNYCNHKNKPLAKVALPNLWKKLKVKCLNSNRPARAEYTFRRIIMDSFKDIYNFKEARLGKYQLDVADMKRKICIEFDEHHHSEKNDRAKNKVLKENRFLTIRVKKALNIGERINFVIKKLKHGKKFKRL